MKTNVKFGTPIIKLLFNVVPKQNAMSIIFMHNLKTTWWNLRFACLKILQINLCGKKAPIIFHVVFKYYLKIHILKKHNNSALLYFQNKRQSHFFILIFMIVSWYFRELKIFISKAFHFSTVLLNKA